MKKINSNRLSAFKLMIIIPVVLATVYLVSCSKDQNTDKGLNVDSKDVKTATEEIAPPPPPPPPPVTNKVKATTKTDTIVDKEFGSFDIDEKPEFPGGDKALQKYVADNTVYPKEALEKGKEGTVYVRFVVTELGKIGDLKVLKKVDPLLEAEALRVVSTFPEWKPGMKNGQPVNVWFICPVKFKLK